jgi:hypothetical protein
MLGYIAGRARLTRDQSAVPPNRVSVGYVASRCAALVRGCPCPNGGVAPAGFVALLWAILARLCRTATGLEPM